MEPGRHLPGDQIRLVHVANLRRVAEHVKAGRLPSHQTGMVPFLDQPGESLTLERGVHGEIGGGVADVVVGTDLSRHTQRN